MDHAGRQLGQRLVNGTDSSRSAGRLPASKPGAMDHTGRQLGQRLVDGTDSSRPAGRRHGSGRAPWAMLGHQHQQASAMDHAGRRLGQRLVNGTDSSRSAGRRHRPWAMLGHQHQHQHQHQRHAGRQCQASRPAPWIRPGASSTRPASRRHRPSAMLGHRHQHQQQAGAMDHAGRQLGQCLVNGINSSRPAPSGTPGAIGHGPSAMGHGPWAMLGHWHQHQQQAGTIGQRLVDGTDSSRPAGQQAGRHGSGRGPWITLARQTGSPGRSKPGARGAPGETLLAPNSGTTRRRCKALPQGKSRRERARNQAKKSMYV